MRDNINNSDSDNNKGKEDQEDQFKEKTDKKKTLSAADLSLDMSDFKINKQTIDLLVANVIPTTKYFESRFDHMQFQINLVNKDINTFKLSVDKSFEKVDQRFEKVDQRFEAMQTNMDQRFEAMQTNMDQRFEAMQTNMDQRFEKVDQRFEAIISSINRLSDKLDGRDEKQRNFTLRMFTIAISISIIGVMGAFLKSLGII